MLLLSIHPKHVESILAGRKSVELRRRRPRIDSGPALIYATAPRMGIVASMHIARIERAPLARLWQSVRRGAAITRHEFDAYFVGLDFGVALWITDIIEFDQPVSLDMMRATWGAFHPPQGFRYIDRSDLAKLGICNRRRAA
jgi:predicted transcriptional regulator